jgi:hypothetical protein
LQYNPFPGDSCKVVTFYNTEGVILALISATLM